MTVATYTDAQIQQMSVSAEQQVGSAAWSAKRFKEYMAKGMPPEQAMAQASDGLIQPQQATGIVQTAAPSPQPGFQSPPAATTQPVAPATAAAPPVNTSQISQNAEALVGPSAWDSRGFKKKVDGGMPVEQALAESSGGLINGPVAAKMATGQSVTQYNAQTAGMGANDAAVSNVKGEPTKYDPNNPEHVAIVQSWSPANASGQAYITEHAEVEETPSRGTDVGPQGQSEASLGKITNRTTIDGKAAAQTADGKWHVVENGAYRDATPAESQKTQSGAPPAAPAAPAKPPPVQSAAPIPPPVVTAPPVTALQTGPQTPVAGPAAGSPTVARDGQTLSSQSPETQAQFRAAYGAGADARWVTEHNAALGPSGAPVQPIVPKPTAPTGPAPAPGGGAYVSPPTGARTASDGQTLAMQSPETQAAFRAAYGPDADAYWITEHEKGLTNLPPGGAVGQPGGPVAGPAGPSGQPGPPVPPTTAPPGPPTTPVAPGGNEQFNYEKEYIALQTAINEADMAYKEKRLELVDVPLVEVEKEKLAQAAAAAAFDQKIKEATLTGQYNGMDTLAQQTLDTNTALSLINTMGQLRGPSNAFQQQAALSGINQSGLANSLGAITGGAPSPLFQAPQGQPQPATLQTMFADIQNPSGQFVSPAPYQPGGGVAGQPVQYSGTQMTTQPGQPQQYGAQPAMAGQPVMMAGPQDYVNALVAPNKIVARKWNKQPKSTQDFYLSAYGAAGYDPNDVQYTINATLPQFTSPAMGRIA